MVGRITRLFKEKFGSYTLVVSSPGRVNLLGEHTDYNEGFVLPAAVDKVVVFAVAPRRDARCCLFAADPGEYHESDVASPQHSSRRWPNYLLGVIDELNRAGHPIGGFSCVFGGDIPIGAGMSSSAAIEAGLAFALNELFRLGIGKLELVKLAQRAENNFVGVRCGIMDQFVNIFGRENTVIKLDCRSLAFDYVPFADNATQIVLADTRVNRELASSEYNVRRRQCESGVGVLQRFYPHIRSLRDATPAMLVDHKEEFDPIVYKRCAYVLRENTRVLAACDDLARRDLSSFGKRMYESHNGLRNEYEVSSPELDELVDVAATITGVYGARMMGAGFGGCTINVIEKSHLEEFAALSRQRYYQKFGKRMELYLASIRSGTGTIPELNPDD